MKEYVLWKMMILFLACLASRIVCAKFEQWSQEQSSCSYHGGSVAKTLPSQTTPAATQAILFSFCISTGSPSSLFKPHT